MRIDLHIHTIATEKDSEFEFSIDCLNEYIKKNEINCIAVTNHNCFDLNQFKDIVNNVGEDCKVLPGIEIDYEEGHILLISDGLDCKSFDEKCKKINNICDEKKEGLNYSELISVFISFDNYLIIPHFKKSSKNVSQSSLIPFGKNIFCGEVGSPKKFETTKKDTNSLVPVIFSDSRPGEKNSKGVIKRITSSTFVDINECTLPNLKLVLQDRNKISINKDFKDNNFEVLDGQILASNKLNVVIGMRSSGKTYLLDSINDSYCNSSKIQYLKQFEIVSKSEDDNFKKIIKNYVATSTNIFEKEIVDVFEFAYKHNIYENECEIDSYCSGLINYCNNSSLHDEYSKCKIYSDTYEYEDEDCEISSLLSSISTLINSIKHKKLINEYLDYNKLIMLFQELIKIKKQDILQSILIEKSKTIVNKLIDELQTRSATNPIPTISFKNLFRNLYSTKKFNSLITKIYSFGIIYKEKLFEKFSIDIEISKNDKISNFKHDSIKLTKKDFPQIDSYLKEKDALCTISYLSSKTKYNKDLVKLFFKYNIKITNDKNLELSGGEKAEFNLMSYLEKAKTFDFLLIDELESSFDNVFLNEYIIKAIQNISKDVTVFISTHNNSLGVLLKADKLIYTKCSNDSYGKPIFDIYSGHYLDKLLENKTGETINSRNVLIETMEGGESPMEERRRIYETLKSH